MVLDPISHPHRKPSKGWWTQAVHLPSFRQLVSAARSWCRASLNLMSFLTASSIPVPTRDDISGKPPRGLDLPRSPECCTFLLAKEAVAEFTMCWSAFNYLLWVLSLYSLENPLQWWTYSWHLNGKGIPSLPFAPVLLWISHCWLSFINRIIKSKSKRKINPFMFCDSEALRCCKEWKHFFF